MQHDVGVGVTGQSLFTGKLHTPEHQSAPLAKPVYVVPGADTQARAVGTNFPSNNELFCSTTPDGEEFCYILPSSFSSIQGEITGGIIFALGGS